MGFFGMFGKDAGEAVAKPVAAIGTALDKLMTSDDERLQAAAVMEKLRNNPFELASAINMIDAQSRNWFQAGWRPFMGWVCGVSLAVYYIPKLVLAAFLWGKICLATGAFVAYPPVDVGEIMKIVLGLGAARTIDKLGGASK